MKAKKTPSRTTINPAKARKGVAAVEFAVVLPVIVLILASALEIACAVQVLSALQNAAREGARHAVVKGATSSTTREICLSSIKSSGVQAPKISIQPDPQSAKSGTFIKITVSASAAENSWIQIVKLFGEKELASTVTMRKE